MITIRIKILDDLRFYLEKVFLCNETRVRILNYSIPFSVMNILCSLPQTITLICLMNAVYIANFDLNEISSAFAISIGVLQIDLIYFSLAANRPTIVKIMDAMQSVVDDRKTLLQFCVFS